MLSAAHALKALPRTRCLAISDLYRSAPIEAQGPDFLNAVALLDTALSAQELLDELQRIETEHGRERPYRNAPRSLDLDLLLYGDVTLHSRRLTLPHARLHQRAFVLRPLLELAPEAQVPGQGPASMLMPGVAEQAVERLGPWVAL